MKKVLLSILMLIYMALSSGIAMEVHYCMGKRAGVDLFETGNNKCGRCGMKEKKTGCCHDEHMFHKLEDSHKNIYNNISFDAGQFVRVSSYPACTWQATILQDYEYINNNAPPSDTGPSSCILYCIFRI